MFEDINYWRRYFQTTWLINNNPIPWIYFILCEWREESREWRNLNPIYQHQQQLTNCSCTTDIYIYFYKFYLKMWQLVKCVAFENIMYQRYNICARAYEGALGGVTDWGIKINLVRIMLFTIFDIWLYFFQSNYFSQKRFDYLLNCI